MKMLTKLEKFFKHKGSPAHSPRYDTAEMTPAIRCSICTGEQVAGFKNLKTGQFVDVLLLKSPGDLESFREEWGIEGEIPRVY